MEATRLGYDMYTAEVDDKGIDFVMRKGDAPFVEVQVKAVGSSQPDRQRARRHSDSRAGRYKHKAV
jgi:hypothetical protein